jgi:phosphoglycerate kinase
VRDNPDEPLVVVMGGVKLETRIPMIEQFVEKADKIIFGGAMIFTFFKAQGKEVGKSIVDEAFVDMARELLEKYPEKLVLPVDVDAAVAFEENAEHTVASIDEIPEDAMGLDIGPESVKHFLDACRSAKTVVWNGPLGAFELKPFNEGTEHFAEGLAELDAYTVIGGGDTASALESAGIADRMGFVSTGGGASLTLLEGKTLPGIEALHDK